MDERALCHTSFYQLKGRDPPAFMSGSNTHRSNDTGWAGAYQTGVLPLCATWPQHQYLHYPLLLICLNYANYASKLYAKDFTMCKFLYL